MDKKHLKLPKEGLAEPEEAVRRFIDGSDVEGHGLPTTAPPSIGARRGAGHGGENIPDPTDDVDDAVEGHAIRRA